MRNTLIAFLLLCTPACGTPDSQLERQTGAGKSSVGASTIIGSQIDTYVTDSGSVQQPVNLSSTTISAIVVDDQGELITLPGGGAADGTFSIPNVPPGTYTLRVGILFFVTDARVVDLGILRRGRPDAVVAQISPTYIILNVDNLRPWAVDDSFFLFSSNLGVVGTNSTLLSPPEAGATSSEPDTRFDYRTSSLSSPFLFDASRGDRLLLNQFGRRLSLPSALLYVSAERTLLAPPFTQTDGSPATVAGTMASVANESLRVRWYRRLYDLFRPLVNPGAVLTNSIFVAIKQETAVSLNGNLTVLSIPFSQRGDLLSDVDESFTYGVSNMPDWPQFGQFQTGYGIPYQLPGTAPLTLSSVNLATVDLDILRQGEFSALISPPFDLRVNGSSAAGDLVDITLPVTVSWAPALGGASIYRVAVYRLTEIAGRTTAVFQAMISTFGTELIVPPSVMAAGGATYNIVVTAVTGVGPDASHPQSSNLRIPWGRADALTGILTTR